MAWSLPIENILPLSVGSIIKLLAVMLLELLNGLLTVAVNHSQLRTMESGTVHPDPYAHMLSPYVEGHMRICFHLTLRAICSYAFTLRLGPYESKSRGNAA